MLHTLFGTQSVLIGTILPFLIVLTVVVFVHEMGHYLVGRWCGIGVKAFSVGFGPELIGFNDRQGHALEAFGNSARRVCQIRRRRGCIQLRSYRRPKR